MAFQLIALEPLSFRETHLRYLQLKLYDAWDLSDEMEQMKQNPL